MYYEPKPKNKYGCIWWVIVPLGLYLLSKILGSPGTSVPNYPYDNGSEEGAEYLADMRDEPIGRDYDPAMRYDSTNQAELRSWAQEATITSYERSERTEPICVIKGNVSFDTGEKIYHLPGDEFYNQVVIDPAYGERWFCSEAEAISAGWRHSYQ